MNLKEVNSILFVCMGNICRSPTAEAVFKQKMHALKLSIVTDSAGTLGAHAREKPDQRAQKAGKARGYSFNNMRARKVTLEDFAKFDLILAMDQRNLNDLYTIAPEQYQFKIKLMLSFAQHQTETDVPDPYYGGAQGFNYVLDLIEDASDGLLQQLAADHE